MEYIIKFKHGTTHETKTLVKHFPAEWMIPAFMNFIEEAYGHKLISFEPVESKVKS